MKLTVSSIAVSASLLFAFFSGASAFAAPVTVHRFENVGGTESLDSSGNEQIGVVKEAILVPGVGKGRFTGGLGGKFGGALYFDSPYGDETFARFTSDFDISAAGSISFFVEHDYVSYRQAYLRGGAGDLSVEMHSGNTVFSSMPGGDTFFSTGAKMLADGTWRHVMVTWDAANGNSQRLYVDGVLQREASNCCVAGVGSTFLGTNITIGQRFPHGAEGTRNFDGGIDDLAFWNRQLSDVEVAAIRDGSASAVPSGLVVYWNLDDAIGTDTAPSNGGSNSINLLAGGGGGILEVGPDLVAAAGPTIDGVTLDAAEFDNLKPTSPNANTKITIPDSPVMDFDKTQGTVVMWINKKSTGFGETYLSTDDATAQILLRSSNSGRTIMRVNGDTVWETASGVSLLDQTNEWHHLAFTWDATTGEHRIYIDGAMPDQGLESGTPGPWDAAAVSDTGDWRIGFDIADRPFSGWIADFAVFDEVLPPESIQEIIDGSVGNFIGCGDMYAAVLDLGKVNVDPLAGNDSMRIKAEYAPPGVLFPALDPGANGARVRIETTDGTIVNDVFLPAGLSTSPTTAGWKRSRDGRRWVYRNISGDPSLNGINYFQMYDIRKPIPGRIGVKVRGVKGTYPLVDADLPLRLIVAIGNTVVGECGEAVFDPAECTWRVGRRYVRCKREP